MSQGTKAKALKQGLQVKVLWKGDTSTLPGPSSQGAVEGHHFHPAGPK